MWKAGQLITIVGNNRRAVFQIVKAKSEWDYLLAKRIRDDGRLPKMPKNCCLRTIKIVKIKTNVCGNQDN